MEALKTALTQFVNHVTQTVGVYASVIVIFVFHVGLEKDLPCTCKDQHTVCWLYMILPACLIFLFVLWVDKIFQTALTNIRRTRYKSHFCAVFWIVILKAFCVGLLWVVAVLLDGDWFICCENNEDGHQQLACKDKANITAEEQTIRNKLVGESMIWGLPILLGVVLMTAVLSSIQACCKKKNRLHQIILEEGEKLVTKSLREAVKDNVKEKLNERNRSWGESFNVIDELSEEMLSVETRAPGLLNRILTYIRCDK